GGGDTRAGDVAYGSHALGGVVAAGPIVFEVVVGCHALAVALGGLLKARIGLQRLLAVSEAFAVDQAQHRVTDALKVGVARDEAGVGTLAGAGGRGPLFEAQLRRWAPCPAVPAPPREGTLVSAVPAAAHEMHEVPSPEHVGAAAVEFEVAA